MCYGCWEEAGRPAIVNGRTVAALPLIEAVYAESEVGGALHIVLDDWNLEDDDVAWCASDECASGQGRPFTDAEGRCTAAFVAMTEPERASALALYEGFIAQPALVPE